MDARIGYSGATGGSDLLFLEAVQEFPGGEAHVVLPCNEEAYVRTSVAPGGPEWEGRYRVEVYTDAAFAQSKHAHYVVRAGATDHAVTLDQTAVDGRVRRFSVCRNLRQYDPTAIGRYSNARNRIFSDHGRGLSFEIEVAEHLLPGLKHRTHRQHFGLATGEVDLGPGFT